MIMFVILYIPFPDEAHNIIGGMIQFNEKTKQYNILIDSRQSEEQQLFTLKHEFGHVMLGHLEDSSKPTIIKESEADDYAHAMTDAFFDAFMSLSEVIHC